MSRRILWLVVLTIVLTSGLIGQSSADGQRRRRKARASPPPPTTSPTPVVNKVNEPHTFTVLVETERTNGNGWIPVENAHVTVTLTNSNGAVATPPGPFVGVTDADGHYSFTINSATTGTITCHASATWQNVTVETDGIAPNSGDAVKVYISVRMKITFI